MPRPFVILGTLTLARLREFYRDPVAVFWVHAFPLLVMLALGAAFSQPETRLLSVDLVPGAGGNPEAVMNILRRQPDLRVAPRDQAEATRRLRRAECSLVLEQGEGATLFALHDPQRPDSVLALARVLAAFAVADRVHVRLKTVGVASQRYIDFLVPGLLGVGLMGGGLVGMGYVLVDLRRRGLLKRLRATPARPWQLLAALMLARAAFLLPEAGILLLASWLLFGVSCAGSPFLLAFVLLLGMVQFLALGLLLGAKLRTMEAISGLVSLLMLTQWVFSGVFFGVGAFPAEAQPWLAWLPLTPLVAALRAVMIEGAGLAALLPDLARIAAWTAGSLVLGLALFQGD